ncbi:MAG TPA: hypothetical protein VKT52_01610 [Ktedonobacterales bacterium]|nr:hypothetical protein [Ktedonobacterales bacterium]
MQILPLALFLVLLELTIGSYVTIYVLDLRGDTSRGFVVFQGVLYLVFAGITILAMNAVTPAHPSNYGLDASWLRWQGPLVVAFALLMIPWNVLLWRDKQPRAQAKKAAKSSNPAAPAPPSRRVRFVLGGLTSLVGLVALFVVGMGYRTLADSHLGGAFVVLALLAGGIALGGTMTAMLLGHWYLNTPTASGKPLEFTTIVLVVALALELVFTLGIGPATAHTKLQTSAVAPGTTIQAGSDGSIKISTPTVKPGTVDTSQARQAETQRVAPLGMGAFIWLQVIMGLLAPLILGGVALYLTRGRSFQSATGMLYLCVSFVFIGEIIGRGLLLFPAI